MPEVRTVVFVCLHGAAKSVIAAALLERLAAEAGLPVRALARGTEPEPVMAPGAVAGLRAEGLDLPGHDPLELSESDLAGAWRVVSFGPELSDLVPGPGGLECWRDVPAVSDGFSAAHDAIADHVKQLAAEIAAD